MDEVFRHTRTLDAWLQRACQASRPVPSLVAENAAEERARLVGELRSGKCPVPAFRERAPRVEAAGYRALDQARRHAERLPVADLYLDKFDELELDLAIREAWGDSRRIRPLAARRYGVGDDPVPTRDTIQPLVDAARGLLDDLSEMPPEPACLPPLAASGEPSVGAMAKRAAAALGLDIEVRVEPRLASLAASGERTVFLADRQFGAREARRLVAHEVFGHLVVAANARAQPLRLLEVGLAGAFADQEGVALYIEEQLGLLCSSRLRVLAARVLATHWLHAGASFGDTAVRLHRDHGLQPDAAIAVAERAYRGGGVARDAGYLAGWLRVRRAVGSGEMTLDELRMGRVGVSDVPRLRRWVAQGYARDSVYRPSLAVSARLTDSGTRAETSPPSIAASLTMFELT